MRNASVFAQGAVLADFTRRSLECAVRELSPRAEMRSNSLLDATRAPLVIRDATLEDYEAFARFFSELHAPEPVPSARVYEEHLVQRAFIGVESGAPSAFACWRPEGAAALHVSMVAVLPERRRRGLGRRMMLEAARRGHTLGFTRWRLNVGIDNAAAQALYQQLGMSASFENVLLELDAALAIRLSSMGSRAAKARIVGRFGEQPPAVRDDGPPVRVVVSDDASLVSELRAAGGLVLHRTLRMCGEMPESHLGCQEGATRFVHNMWTYLAMCKIQAIYYVQVKWTPSSSPSTF
jgi:ribosomal protein S18 acetylase RimI-like enzyme